MSRKTIKVSDLREHINRILLSPVDDDVKAGMCGLLEGWLHETGNYHGFAYMKADGTHESAKTIHNNEHAEYRRHYYGG